MSKLHYENTLFLTESMIETNNVSWLANQIAYWTEYTPYELLDWETQRAYDLAFNYLNS